MKGVVEDTKKALNNKLAELGKSLEDLYGYSPVDQEKRFHYTMIEATRKQLKATKQFLRTIEESPLEDLLQDPEILLLFVETYVSRCKNRWTLSELDKKLQSLSETVQERIQLLKKLDELEEKRREAEKALKS